MLNTIIFCVKYDDSMNNNNELRISTNFGNKIIEFFQKIENKTNINKDWQELGKMISKENILDLIKFDGRQITLHVRNTLQNIQIIEIEIITLIETIIRLLTKKLN